MLIRNIKANYRGFIQKNIIDCFLWFFCRDYFSGMRIRFLSKITNQATGICAELTKFRCFFVCPAPKTEVRVWEKALDPKQRKKPRISGKYPNWTFSFFLLN